ncbi:MAG: hypothetical protein ACQETK_08155 [Pseudomonadota bacterium]
MAQRVNGKHESRRGLCPAGGRARVLGGWCLAVLGLMFGPAQAESLAQTIEGRSLSPSAGLSALDVSEPAGPARAPARERSDSRYHLTLRADHDPVSLFENEEAVLNTRVFEAVGGYRQEFGSSGFGYGLNLGVGMQSGETWNDLGPGQEFNSYFTDLSFGPTFAAGRFDSQFRIGLRQPLTSDESHPGFGFGSRHRDIGRTAGYLSLDGRVRLQNQSELSMSLYYDDYTMHEPDSGWLADRLEFDGASPDAASSVIGVEMGLTF